MTEGSRHLEASLAQAGLLAVLGLTALMGATATAAYIWHLYRLIVLNG